MVCTLVCLASSKLCAWNLATFCETWCVYSYRCTAFLRMSMLAMHVSTLLLMLIWDFSSAGLLCTVLLWLILYLALVNMCMCPEKHWYMLQTPQGSCRTFVSTPPAVQEGSSCSAGAAL